jgi:hypothetical protein
MSLQPHLRSFKASFELRLGIGEPLMVCEEAPNQQNNHLIQSTDLRPPQSQRTNTRPFTFREAVMAS